MSAEPAGDPVEGRAGTTRMDGGGSRRRLGAGDLENGDPFI